MSELKDPQLKVSTFFELTPDLVCIAGKDGFFKKVNRAVIDKLGYTENELMSIPIDSFIYPEDKQITSNEREELLKGKSLLNFQNQKKKKNGELIWLEWTSIYFSEEEVVFAIAKDISAKKQIEKEVEEKQE